MQVYLPATKYERILVLGISDNRSYQRNLCGSKNQTEGFIEFIHCEFERRPKGNSTEKSKLSHLRISEDNC